MYIYRKKPQFTLLLLCNTRHDEKKRHETMMMETRENGDAEI